MTARESHRPIIGITADVAEYDWLGQPRLRAQSAMTYAAAVTEAGALPVILAPLATLAEEYVDRCDAIVLTGGDDPIMEAFGGVTHPKARTMHPKRQDFELALLRALDARREKPALGICLGMQLMTLHAGGRLNQCLAETLGSHAQHVSDASHLVRPEAGAASICTLVGAVASNHRQAAESAGSLRVAARSDDGVIEAVDDPSRRFYLGVQWHPERTPDPKLGAGVFAALVAAARGAASNQP